MIGLLTGLGVTFRHMVRPSINERYPYRKRDLAGRSRGSVAMVFAEGGSSLCRACQVCARDCPDEALSIEVEKPAEGAGRVLVSLTLDLGRCMFCGLCVENCPSGALAMTPDFEHATWESGGMMRELYRSPAEDASQSVGERVAADASTEPEAG